MTAFEIHGNPILVNAMLREQGYIHDTVPCRNRNYNRMLKYGYDPVKKDIVLESCAVVTCMAAPGEVVVVSYPNGIVDTVTCNVIPMEDVNKY